MATLPFHILVIRSFLPLFGFAVGKTCIVLGSDVAQVAHDIHYFVVTEQAHDPAACLYRFLLERHHQVHDLARLGAAIQEVPDLDERCLTACPMVLLVGKTGTPENAHEVVKVIVDIGDGDYGFRRFRWSLCWLRPRQHHRHQDQEDGNTSAVGSITDRRADYFPAFYSQAAEFWRKHCVPQGVLYWGAS